MKWAKRVKNGFQFNFCQLCWKNTDKICVWSVCSTAAAVEWNENSVKETKQNLTSLQMFQLQTKTFGSQLESNSVYKLSTVSLSMRRVFVHLVSFHLGFFVC